MELGGLEPPTSTLPVSRSSQLNYSPFEIEVISEVNVCLLVIPGGHQTQLHLMPAGEYRRWQQEAAIDLSGVRGEEIDLVC